MRGRGLIGKNFSCFCALKNAQFFIFCLLLFPFSTQNSAVDTITPDQNVTDGKTLVSAQKVFELGFFSPGKGSRNKRYLGIWYYGIRPQTVVWVANREKPVLDNHGVFVMRNNGELQVMDGKGIILWSLNSTANSSRVLPANATLMDNGNLVLQRGKDILWESFWDESNTFLSGMNMKNKSLRSWKSDSDPAPGDFTFKVYAKEGNQFMIQNRSDTYWMSGWSNLSVSFNDVREDLVSMMIPDNNDAIITPDVKNRLVMNSSGHIEFFRWMGGSNNWSLSWSKPSDVCSFYQACGDYGICSVGDNKKPNCTCLPGFLQTSEAESGNYSRPRGCRRHVTGCSEDDPFADVRLDKVSYPDNHFEAGSEEVCKNYCRKKCCSAYFFAYDSRQGRNDNMPSTCWTWSSYETLKSLNSDNSFGGNLRVRLGGTTASGSCVTQTKSTLCIQPRHGCNSQEDCSQFPNSTCQRNAERDKSGWCNCILSFHWDPKAANCAPDTENKSPLYGSSQHSKPLLLIIPLSTIAGIAFTAVAVVGIKSFQKKMTVRRARRNTFEGKSTLQNEESDIGVRELVGFDEFQEDRTKSIDVPFYDFEMIVAATDDFSLSNKLGQGGFGPVYKGKFRGGQEIAVKRLSRSSGQGLEEFKNEVVLIAKLQHRNLVRLLGYCMKRDEKMLIYEYLPNRSLDSIVFDPKKCLLLSWEMRYNIIVGVARGLQYLHQDSRLRIVHRDLKTSNILLDEEMNPKISDFGMARIFGGKQTQANTTRVVGTYGYMSPEYAIDGLFSIKSDVFSFGVVVLEIISGKRNTLFYHKEQALTLLGYAWKLWYENMGLDLMDPSLREDCNEGQALRCIQVALLCVQDDAADRPTMTEVVFMLSSETAVVPNPRQPIFVVKRFSESLASSSNQGTGSNNELTITFEGR
ncbi:hypothetical protein SLEP1_g39633 [Rubroshorea leprosula]|uniref:Receptor-like serine/threonine-protein kinase n=1 Tax=Rubroshorea leprosula TaxID=152421 RepID=A0AAV5L113_9ROSI|nr:hypothetical protein SLEP1_g39633 [Rubroshorea leprosula]